MKGFVEASAVRNYLKLMHEVVVRLDLVSAACDGHVNLTPPYALEYCYLQYRRICELLALGCLQLHGDLPAAKSTAASKEWNAERIMGLLHRSHPHAFPQCVTLPRLGTDVKINSAEEIRYLLNARESGLLEFPANLYSAEVGIYPRRVVVAETEA